jgi:hypothetical protein
MGTAVINNIEGILHIKNGDLLAIHLDQLPLTKSDFTGFTYFDKPCHNSPPKKFLLEPSYPPNIFPAWQITPSDRTAAGLGGSARGVSVAPSVGLPTVARISFQKFPSYMKPS